MRSFGIYCDDPVLFPPTESDFAPTVDTSERKASQTQQDFTPNIYEFEA